LADHGAHLPGFPVAVCIDHDAYRPTVWSCGIGGRPGAEGHRR
jgi:hypothetical protein